MNAAEDTAWNNHVGCADFLTPCRQARHSTIGLAQGLTVLPPARNHNVTRMPETTSAITPQQCPRAFVDIDNLPVGITDPYRQVELFDPPGYCCELPIVLHISTLGSALRLLCSLPACRRNNQPGVRPRSIDRPPASGEINRSLDYEPEQRLLTPRLEIGVHTL